MGWEDERGVSEVLGAILLFGILVLAIGGYQSFVVPQQNAEIEHEHDMQVNDEFPEIQKAISNAVARGRPQTASITLGTDYPLRALTVNPPGVAGTLSTDASGHITVVEDDGDEFNVVQHDDFCSVTNHEESRAIRYEANYNRHSGTGHFVYENGVTYRKVGDDVVAKNEQELISGSTIRLYPLATDDFSRTSTGREQLRFEPAETDVSPSVRVQNITLPTQLSEDQWAEILHGEVDGEDISVEGNEVTLELDGVYDVRCTPVGIGKKPEQGEVSGDLPDPEDVANQINPNGRNDIALVDTSVIEANTKRDASIYLENRKSTEQDVEITGARLNFFSGTSPGYSPRGESFLTFDSNGYEYRPGGEFRRFDESDYIPLDGEGATEVDLTFEEAISSDDFYVLTLEYSNGKVGLYFVSHSSNGNS